MKKVKISRKAIRTFSTVIATMLFIIFTIVMVTGCSSDVVERGYSDGEELDTTFTRYPIGDNYSILVKKDNGVCYLEWKDGIAENKTYGITVMRNPDGTPEIWDGNY